MTIDWSLKNISNWETVCNVTDPETKEKYRNPVTDCLIYYSIYIGMPKITEKNAETFYQRMKEHFELTGGIYYRWVEKPCIIYMNANAQELPEDFVTEYVLANNLITVTKNLIKVKTQLGTEILEVLGLRNPTTEELKEATHSVIEYFIPTIDEVKKHIGLSTNASTYTTSQWKEQKLKITKK